MGTPVVWLLMASNPPVLAVPEQEIRVELGARSATAEDLLHGLAGEHGALTMPEVSWRSAKRSLSNVLRHAVSEDVMAAFGLAAGAQPWQLLFRRSGSTVRLQPWVKSDYWVVIDLLEAWLPAPAAEDGRTVSIGRLGTLLGSVHLDGSHAQALAQVVPLWPESRQPAFQSLGPLAQSRAAALAEEIVKRQPSSQSGHRRQLHPGEFRTLFVWSPPIIDDLVHQEERLVEMLASELPIPNAMRYSSIDGTRRWLRLANLAVNSHQAASVALVEQLADDIAVAVGSRTGIDFVSLGPGDGVKDAKLLRAISGHTTGGIFYYAVDISPLMVGAAILHVEREVRDIESLGVIADFTQKSTRIRDLIMNDRAGAPNVLSLLGNTIGNIDDDWDFIEKLGRTLRPGDFLILDVRRVESLERSIVEIEGLPERHEFHLGPLEAIRADYDERNLYTTRTTDAHGDIAVKVFCSGVSHRGFSSQVVEVAKIKHYSETYFDRVAAVIGADILVRRMSKQADTETAVFGRL